MNQQPTHSPLTRVTKSHSQLTASISLMFSLLLVACGDPPFAMVQSHVVTTDPGAPFGYSCGQLDQSGEASTGSGENGGNGNEFWQNETHDGDGVSIEWGIGSQVLGSREFPTEFFEAHNMKRFTIEAPDGTKISYTVWGADSCTPCPEQPYTPLPGDISGCGQAHETDAGSASNDDSPGNVDDPNEDEGKVDDR